SRIADRLNFNRFQCNDLNVENSVLDGTVVEPILGRAAKAEILTAWAAELGLAQDDVLAVGDGSNDLAMLGITALLYLQGYKQEDFA
ncbi:MAG: haloacid dehalogenase-like hydrolase, partial [Rhodobiaceae bacterium]